MRFEVYQITERAWNIKDNDTKKWNVPNGDRVLFMNVREEAAKLICDTLNKEWIAFQRDPS